MRVVFMGTPEFAVPCLQKLIDCGHEVTGVFTQPDKPQGRKMILTPPPVKELALANNIKVYQPLKMRDGTALRFPVERVKRKHQVAFGVSVDQRRLFSRRKINIVGIAF